MPSYPYRRDPVTGLTTATPAPPYIPPSAQGTIALFEAKGHTVTVRQTRQGSNRYRLDQERERNALELSNRWRRLYSDGPNAAAPECMANNFFGIDRF